MGKKTAEKDFLEVLKNDKNIEYRRLSNKNLEEIFAKVCNS